MTDVDKNRKLTELAERIRRARVSARLSQQALGKSIGVSDKSISAYEQGRSEPPLGNLKKIAKSTQHPLSYFTDETNHSSEIAAKLQAIERELAEVKRLLISEKE